MNHRNSSIRSFGEHDRIRRRHGIRAWPKQWWREKKERKIRFGIRPLLYSLLRREFLYPRGLKVCANIMCRNLFEVERAGQQFCDELCSRRERQRQYWQNQGKAAREARLTRSKDQKL
jgi:hypothetical protein